MSIEYKFIGLAALKIIARANKIVRRQWSVVRCAAGVSCRLKLERADDEAKNNGQLTTNDGQL
ncbi:MAG: hypothetical protein DMF64_05780 [Acidobacteria bacterium]|nr:MAG: hypothetical protein DMF64_05780 [Acidobacteriota bacterium]